LIEWHTNLILPKGKREGRENRSKIRAQKMLLQEDAATTVSQTHRASGTCPRERLVPDGYLDIVSHEVIIKHLATRKASPAEKAP
jgi:hypothetical protein